MSFYRHYNCLCYVISDASLLDLFINDIKSFVDVSANVINGVDHYDFWIEGYYDNQSIQEMMSSRILPYIDYRSFLGLLAIEIRG